MAAVVLVAMMPAVPSVGAQQAGEQAPTHVQGRALIGAKVGERSLAAAAIAGHGGRVISYYAPGNFFIVDTPSRAPEWVRSIRSDSRVRYAELDYTLSVDTHNDSTAPNDSMWTTPGMWGLQKIKAEEAWDVSKGSESIVVGVIDTGVKYNHEDIGVGQMWVNPGEFAGNGVDDDKNGVIDDVYGYDCRNNDGDPMDDNNHGTHVSGTIGAATNNATGVAGINWDVSIMALKFLDASGSGSTSDAIKCLDYAINKGANLTSNSWGGGGYSQALRDAIKRAELANQLFVAAAGNDGRNTDVNPSYPASYDLDNIISVAATDSNDQPASFTNYGVSTVDLAAPGVGIWSTVLSGYASYSGTSMATPHVAGVAALVLSRYGGSTSYRTVLDRIYGSVDPIAVLGTKVATGGRLNAARAVEVDTTPPGAMALTAGTGTSAPTRTSVSLSWTAPGDDGATGDAASSYELSYALTGTTNWASAPAPKPAAPGSNQSAIVSGLRPGTSYQFRLTAKDNAGNPSIAFVTASTAAGVVVFSDDMESPSSWQADLPWAITPERPHSLAKTWSDSTNGSYADSKDLSVRSDSSFSLAAASSPKLTFWHRYNLEPGYDYAYVYISTDGGTNWTQLARYNGHLDSYSPVEIDLNPYAGMSNVRLRFRLTTDTSVTYDGWFFDDIIVSAGSTGDTTPPALSGIGATNTTSSSTDIVWTTNEPSDSQVDYQTTSGTTVTVSNASLVTTHSLSLTGLSAGTEYSYTVTSKDAARNSSTSAGPAFTTAVTTVAPRSYPPTSVTILKGTAAIGSDVGSLAASDNNYYQVASRKQGRSHVVDWYGEATVAAGGKTLTLTYEGQYTRSVTQKLYVFNFLTGAWDAISTATATTGGSYTSSTATPAAYISTTGSVRMRVAGTTNAGSYTCWGDLMSFTVEY